MLRSDDVVLDVLKAWEQWPGTTADFYRDLSIKKGQCSSIIKKAKKLVSSGAVIENEFKEISIKDTNYNRPIEAGCGIELVWQSNVIRFGSSDLLVDFLKKVA